MLSPSCSPKHRSFMSVRLNLDCQPEGIKSAYENKCLRMSERVIRLMEAGRPALNLSGTIPWARELNEQKGESELSPSIHYSLLPDCGGHVTSCLLLFRPHLPHDGLYPCGTVSPKTTNKQTHKVLPFLSCLCQVTVTRRVTIHGESPRSSPSTHRIMAGRGFT